MDLLTEDARVVCNHGALVTIIYTQTLVTIGGRKVLVESDPQGRSISRCPNQGVGIKPCMITLVVKKGYSDLLCIEGKRVCLDTVTGLTDGTPPGTVQYKVNKSGQDLVREVE
jgi:hypothetical protein